MRSAAAKRRATSVEAWGRGEVRQAALADPTIQSEGKKWRAHHEE
jgi:hypothetical protein